MKKLIIGLLMLSTLSAYAGTIKDATLSELSVLTTYLTQQFSGDQRLEDVLDDDSLSGSTFKYQGTEYHMLIVYSGDTAHGPIYLPSSLEIVGEMSDGSIIINGSYIDSDQIDYED